MLGLALVGIVSSGSTADLLPPFQPDSNHKIGDWECGGSCIPGPEVIMLIPPVQFKRGSLWTNIMIPNNDWTIDFSLEIHEGTGGGGFAIWLVDQYAEEGNINGGPQIFAGIGLTANIIFDDDRDLSLLFHFVQHSRRDRVFVDILHQPGPQLKIRHFENIHIKLEFRGHTVHVIARSGSQKWQELFTEPITGDFTQNYIGMTAQCDTYTSRIDIRSVTLNLEETINRPASFGGDGPSSSYRPDEERPLRNPFFHKTLTELDLREMNSGKLTNRNISRDDVMDIISEVTRASFSAASFGEMNNFIKEELLPYTHKWHRRTVKIVGHVRKAREVLGSSWNYTSDLIRILSKNIEDVSVKARSEVIQIADLLEYESGRMDEDSKSIEQLKKTSFMLQLVIFVAILELVGVIAFFFLLQNRGFRENWLGM
jgi:hypothetical protein